MRFLKGFDSVQFWLLTNWSLCLILEKLEGKEYERGGRITTRVGARNLKNGLAPLSVSHHFQLQWWGDLEQSMYLAGVGESWGKSGDSGTVEAWLLSGVKDVSFSNLGPLNWHLSAVIICSNYMVVASLSSSKIQNVLHGPSLLIQLHLCHVGVMSHFFLVIISIRHYSRISVSSKY